MFIDLESLARDALVCPPSITFLSKYNGQVRLLDSVASADAAREYDVDTVLVGPVHFILPNVRPDTQKIYAHTGSYSPGKKTQHIPTKRKSSAFFKLLMKIPPPK